MAIDGIGKGGGVSPPGAGGAGGPSRARETGKTFEVDKTEGAAKAHANATTQTEAVTKSTPLTELEAGRLSLDGYLDAKVSEATAHLESMPPAKLETLKTMLRERIASDPTLTDLVSQATGRIPAPPEDS
ncbi:hypothetical protein BH09MYX1_BH09MYX1_22520 [soil metagenome]